MIVSVDRENVREAAAIHSASWQESHRAFCSADFVSAHTPERQEAYLRGKMENGSRVFLLIDRIPAGIVSLNGSTIEDLYVLPEYQNRGYGSALLRFAVAECPGTPTLWILENNHRAEGLYLRAGFRRTGKRKAVTGGLDEIELALDR